ncbi:uncharacterized protein [Ptychodera flava]|uniref:uncharacterized protein n=1 Tax=Ptychodera flava TaxID=63121 RepID=UPI003969CD1B
MGDFLKDRDLTLKVAQKIACLMKSEHFRKQLIDAADPTKGDASKIVARLIEVRSKLIKDAVDEIGASCNTNTFGSLNNQILRQYTNDEEIVEVLSQTVNIEGYIVNKIEIGSPVPDIYLIDVETRENIPLLSLSTSENKPLAFIASSIS